MKITVKMLQDAYACREQVAIFQKAWPTGVEINLRNAHKAVRLGLDVVWAVRHLMSAPAQDAYYKVIAPARDAYYKAIAPAQDAYHKAIAPAFVLAWKKME